MATLNYLSLFLFGNICYGHITKDTYSPYLNDGILASLKRELREEVLLEIRNQIKMEVKAEIKSEVEKELASVLREAAGMHEEDSRSTGTDKKYLVAFVSKVIQTEIKNGLCNSVIEEAKAAFTEQLTTFRCSTCSNYTSDKDHLRHQNTGTVGIRRSSNALLGVAEMKARAAHITQVAFSVYLNHTLDHLPVLTTIKFNKIGINEGDFYNVHTGVFTAPVTGVYMFHFEFIGFYKTTELRLVVDNVIVATAVAAHEASQSVMVKASSTTLTRVNSGQSVWIETYVYVGSNIIASSYDRSSSFLGVLMY